MAAEYSKRMFLNTHEYILIEATAVAESSIDPIRVRVRTLNTFSGGRCWGCQKVVRGELHPPLW